MPPRAARLAGLACSVAYASFIVWVYAHQPSTMARMTSGMAASLGVYEVDRASVDEGLRFFRRDQFVEARAAFERADPARRDPVTQFYIAYSFYRQGWGRTYNNDDLFKQGLEAVGRAIDASPGGRVIVEDPNLGMHSADELKAELERGTTRDLSDLNPLRVFRRRK